MDLIPDFITLAGEAKNELGYLLLSRFDYLSEALGFGVLS